MVHTASAGWFLEQMGNNIFFKSGVPHTTWYLEDMTKCLGSKRKKGMVHNAGARQVFRKYGHPYMF